MNRVRAVLFILVISITNSFAQGYLKKSSGQGINPFRRFISNITVSGSIGYGATFNSHEITSGGIIQNQSSAPLIFDNTFAVTDPIPIAYNNWIGNPSVIRNTPIDTTSFLLGTDSIAVKYKALGTNIPINVSVHYTFDRYRIGGGFAFEPYFVGDYRPNVFKDDLESFNADFKLSYYLRWYFMLGGEVFKTKRNMIVVDAKVGTYSQQKKHFNPDVIKKGIFFNLGVRFEHSLSEYVKVYLRPSVEFKSYTVTIPESTYSITHNLPAFYTNIGVTWRLPDRNKCPIGSCHTQINHHHGRKNYRSRVHPFWKWQDPDYGQNYPKLVKYKGKNKRKINPY
jgi:hypothetical protein